MRDALNAFTGEVKVGEKTIKQLRPKGKCKGHPMLKCVAFSRPLFTSLHAVCINLHRSSQGGALAC